MMKKKKSSEEEKTLYDFGFGLVDPKNSDFEILAKGTGLDPDELANFLNNHASKKTK